MGLFGVCSAAAALYLLSRITGREVEILKSATRISQIKDLESEELFPLIVAISGRVGSETPIKSNHSGILCVLLQETIHQHYLKRNWKFSWGQGTSLMPPVTKQVPWHLDDGTGRVSVVGAQDAIGLPLTFGSEVFQESEPASLLQGTVDFLRGLKMLGVRRVQRVLPIGTQLTVVGEAVKDGTGDVMIQEPEGGPFYVSPVPLDQLILKLGKWSRRFKCASIGLAIVGVILISKPFIESMVVRTACMVERKWQQWLHERDRAAKAAATRRMESRTRELGRRRLERSSGSINRDGQEESGLCVVCLDKKCNTAFVQCGHMCCCDLCSLTLHLQGNVCPLCRKPIDQVLKIYPS